MTTPPLEFADSVLTDWLDAARRGGFPAPARSDRWQALRAGVVNLWEFEQAEFWYARGWAQLTGRNETGKSTLMALTTLIPWLADTTPANIDTFARSGKRFRYYVEPTGADGDRRNPDLGTNRGWLWVEYGRLIDGEPRFFTTLLFAEARSASSSVDLKWCTLEGTARVRERVDLAPHRSVASWKEISDEGFLAHPSASAYKAHVADHLLGSTVDRLEAVGKMLKVTRTPKLGAQLQIGFVQDNLRGALPELSRSEVDALATGWEQLDQIRADLASTSDAAQTVSQFRKKAWIPWVQAILRQRADAAAAARTEFDKVTRSENEAREALSAYEQQQAESEGQSQIAERAADAARAAADQLQSSARYQDAQGRLQSLRHHQQNCEDLRNQLGEREQDLQQSQNLVDSATRERDELKECLVAADQTQARSLDEFAASAQEIHIAVPAAGFDPDRADQQMKDLLGAVRSAENMAEEAAKAEQGALAAESVATNCQERAESDKASADAAWTDAQTIRTALEQSIAVWADGLQPLPVVPTIDYWIDSLPRAIDEDGTIPGPLLKDSFRQRWYDPARDNAEHRRAEADRDFGQAQSEVAGLTARIQELASEPTPVFAQPVGWVRRDRPPASGEGAPLWALLDPSPGLAPAQLAGIEAGLAAMGLLDAWITPDGVYTSERDGDDLVATVSDPVTGPSLADCLHVAEEAGDLTHTAARVLAGVAYGTEGSFPDGTVGVAADGSWRTLGLAGRAHPAHESAEWIGQAARAAGRRRRIQELAEEKALWATRADQAWQAHEAALGELAELFRLFALSPDDMGLRECLTRARERDDAAEASQVAAETSWVEAENKRAAADSVKAGLLSFCAEQRLPFDPAGLRRTRDQIVEASNRLDRYRHESQMAEQVGSQLGLAQRRMDTAQADHGVRLERKNRVAARLADAEATAEAISSTIDADDHQVLEELNRLKLHEAEASARVRQLAEMLRQIGEQVGQARAVLSTAQEKREQATVRREQAFTRFRALVEQGLALQADLDLPQPQSASVDAVRDQVAQTRRSLKPRDWPEGPDQGEEQDAYVRRRESDLIDRAQEARTNLETGYRTLRIVRDAAGLPQVEIVVDSSGQAYGPREAELRLQQIHDEMESTYSQRVQQTLDELLGSTFLEHLRERLGDAYTLVNRINAVLADHPVQTTQTSLRIGLEPNTPADKVMIDAIRGSSLANPEVANQVRNNLRQRVEEAKQSAESEGDPDWRNRLADQLDYRQWLGVHLQRKIGKQGQWGPLTTQTFAEMSGGARAVMLMLPLVSTLAALYEEMDGSPRPLWLDEAFDGLDPANRAMIMGLFQRFDLDVLLGGPARLVNVATVPAAAIYQVVRAPAPEPGADLTAELWAGGELIQIDLPLTLPSGPPEERSEDMLL